ncbi:MAG TPA: hypothetical protein VG649_01775 [Candidatus Angelobacter sp.]|jgi:hypothetical protein|nr:hypothetical protein [Candidatus Angelobacter sp.]
MKIDCRFNGGKAICEKKQDFEARRSTEARRKPKSKVPQVMLSSQAEMNRVIASLSNYEALVSISGKQFKSAFISVELLAATCCAVPPWRVLLFLVAACCSVSLVFFFVLLRG